MREILGSMWRFEMSIQGLENALSQAVVHSRSPRGFDFTAENSVVVNTLARFKFGQCKCTRCVVSGTTCDVPYDGLGTCKQCLDDEVVCSLYVFSVN